MVPTRRIALSLTAVAIAACERSAPPPQIETTAVVTVDSSTEAPRSWSGEWPAELGQVLFVPSDTDNTAIVVYPDAAPAADSTSFTLFTSGGEAALARVTVRGTDTLECGGAPVVNLSGGAFGTWSVGLAGGARVLRSDSLESIAPRDSAQVVASLARMASTITARQETRFNGLPFSVARARRFTVGNTRIVTAHLVRKLPQEASPLEEHTFVVAERPLSSDSLLLRYHQRSDGTEETAEHFEIIAAIGTEKATLLLLARDNATGTRYQILERASTGAWRVRWTRPLNC
jgi:hypothetical protein